MTSVENEKTFQSWLATLKTSPGIREHVPPRVCPSASKNLGTLDAGHTFPLVPSKALIRKEEP